MDIKISNDDISFKVRVAGALVKNGKLLTAKVADNPFYCLPGGHAHVGESLEEAMRREFSEEVKVEPKNVKPITFIENFFASTKGQLTHELCYFYLIDADIETKDYTYIEHDEDKLVRLEFKWIDIKDLNKFDFRPKQLIPQLQTHDFGYKHFVVKDLPTKRHI